MSNESVSKYITDGDMRLYQKQRRYVAMWHDMIYGRNYYQEYQQAVERVRKETDNDKN